jgi:sigma-E factor negative regulatory protein RseA
MKQQISECMDGELDAHGATHVLAQVTVSAEYREHWEMYHLIGDGMREAPDLSAGFTERFAQRLADEATVLAPKPRVIRKSRMANYAMYAAASLAAVAVVSWVAVSPLTQQNAGQMARSDAPALVAKATPQRPELSPLNARDHDYLLAHQAVSPGGMMVGVAPYVRTVSFGTEATSR